MCGRTQVRIPSLKPPSGPEEQVGSPHSTKEKIEVGRSEVSQPQPQTGAGRQTCIQSSDTGRPLPTPEGMGLGVRRPWALLDHSVPLRPLLRRGDNHDRLHNLLGSVQNENAELLVEKYEEFKDGSAERFLKHGAQRGCQGSLLMKPALVLIISASWAISRIEVTNNRALHTLPNLW